nr:glutamate receptor-like [Penaeus vannamei]
MVGELQNRRADLTVSELSVTKERNDVITYTQPIYIVSRKLFVATQEDFQKKLLAYTSPMEMVLYWAILVTMMGLAVFLVFVERLRKYLLPHEELGGLGSLGTATWCMVSALLQQGCDTCPTSMTARMVFWLGFFVSVIVYTSIPPLWYPIWPWRSRRRCPFPIYLSSPSKPAGTRDATKTISFK